jgi:hypothetical protein
MSNISEENIKYLDELNNNQQYSNYISEGHSSERGSDSYKSNHIIIKTPPMSPLTPISIALNSFSNDNNIPMLCNNNPPVRFFNRVDFFYYLCKINSKSVNKFWKSFFAMYIETLLKYIAITKIKSNDITLICVLPLISLINSLLYKKIIFNNPSIDLMLYIFLKKSIKKFIIRAIAQIIASILATITFYYLFYEQSASNSDINKILSYSIGSNNYKNAIIVIFINILFMFMSIKTMQTKEIYYYITFSFISAAIFITTIYNVINPINDITTRLTLLCIYKNYFNNLNIITNTLCSFCGMMFGVIIYIILIDISCD